MNIGIGKSFAGLFVCALALVAMETSHHWSPSATAFRTDSLIVDTQGVFGSGALPGSNFALLSAGSAAFEAKVCNSPDGTCSDVALLPENFVSVNSNPASEHQLYSFHQSSWSQNAVFTSQGSNTIPTGTDEWQAVNAFTQGTINTSASVAGVNVMAIQAASTATRSGGTNPVVNIGVQSNASGGDVNFSFKSGAGTLRNDGPVLLGVTTADSVESTGLLKADNGFTVISGSVAINPGATIGSSTGTTFDANGRITTTLEVRSANPQTEIFDRNTGTGGQLWKLENAGTASSFDAGFSIFDDSNGTSGATSILASRNTGGTPGVVQIGNHLGAGIHYNEIHNSTILTTLNLDASCTSGGSAAINGTDFAFKLTTGSGATSCTITFLQSFTTAPICVINGEAGATFTLGTPTATTLPITTVQSAKIYDVICISQPDGT